MRNHSGPCAASDADSECPPFPRRKSAPTVPTIIESQDSEVDDTYCLPRIRTRFSSIELRESNDGNMLVSFDSSNDGRSTIALRHTPEDKKSFLEKCTNITADLEAAWRDLTARQHEVNTTAAATASDLQRFTWVQREAETRFRECHLLCLRVLDKPTSESVRAALEIWKEFALYGERELSVVLESFITNEQASMKFEQAVRNVRKYEKMIDRIEKVLGSSG